LGVRGGGRARDRFWRPVMRANQWITSVSIATLGALLATEPALAQQVQSAPETASSTARLGQCRPRHAADPGLARPSSNPTHRALYGVKPDAIQGRVALNGRGQPRR